MSRAPRAGAAARKGVTIRLTLEERERWNLMATQRGTSVAEMIRAAIAGLEDEPAAVATVSPSLTLDA